MIGLEEIKTPSAGKRFLWTAGHILRGNVVLVIALIAAAVTCFFVPFDGEYLGYFDLRTLSCLFCTLAVVAALKNIKFFVWLADVIVRRFKNMRNIVLALVFVTYFGSMIMANDMALVTFLPLGWFVLESCGNKKLAAFTFIMQNIPPTWAECSLPSEIRRICTSIPITRSPRRSFLPLWQSRLPSRSC